MVCLQALPEEGITVISHISINNFHIEPTNKCIYNCRFCSYHKNEGDPDSWEYSHDEMLDIVKRFDNKNVTEVHIVGGVHPAYDLHYWGSLIKKIKEHVLPFM